MPTGFHVEGRGPGSKRHFFQKICPITVEARLSVREYNPYELGLTNLAAGISHLRQGRIDSARFRLGLAVSYSMRCGDKIIMAEALSNLGQLYRSSGDNSFADQCIKYAAQVQHIFDSLHRRFMNQPDDLIIRSCEKFYKKEVKSTIVKELIWFFIIPSIISAILANFVTRWAWFFAISAGATRIREFIKKYRMARIYRV